MESNEAASHYSEAQRLKEPLLEQPTTAQEDETSENEAQTMHYEFESPPRPWWKGNVSLYLAICYLIVLWFIFRRGPWRFTKPISVLGGIHVVAACMYAIICCLNVFHTPGHGTLFRRIHMNLGRVGMAAGLVSATVGMVVLYVEDNPIGTRIGLTFAGVSQLAAQVMGMYELFKAKRNLKMHAYYMKQSLLFACFVPAIMRMPELTSLDLGDGWQAIAWVFAFPLYMLNERAEKRQKWY